MNPVNKKVTLKDIAKVLNLSPRAVSNGLNNSGRLAPQTREKIIQTATNLGYIPNAAARSLVTKSSNFIGVLIPYINKSFFCNIIAGISEVTEKNNYMILLDSLDKESKERKEAVIYSLIQHNVAGIILFPRTEDLEIAPLLRSSNIPVIQVMDYFPEFGELSVTMDNFKAASIAMQHLIDKGHKNIGFLGANNKTPSQQERFRAYKEMRKDQKLLYKFCNSSLEDGYNKTLELFTENPQLSAIFATSDASALGAMRAAKERNLAIGKDFSVVGFSDVDIASNQAFYPLTTVSQPKETTGIKAAEILIAKIRNQKTYSISLEAPLVIRKS